MELNSISSREISAVTQIAWRGEDPSLYNSLCFMFYVLYSFVVNMNVVKEKKIDIESKNPERLENWKNTDI